MKVDGGQVLFIAPFGNSCALGDAHAASSGGMGKGWDGQVVHPKSTCIGDWVDMA